jgi:alkylation response protein AidB-like acyl-CoA dehydrogenase
MRAPGKDNNPYSFDEYLRTRERFDYYADDRFFQLLLRKHCAGEYQRVDGELRELSRSVSFRHRHLSDAAGRLDNRLRCTLVEHYDAHNHRVDRLQRCHETETLEHQIFSLGLFDPHRNTAWSRFAKIFLLAQNGEFGVMCPVACTHGMITLMQKYEDAAEHLGEKARQWLVRLRSGETLDSERRYAIGAQYVSEIQGGSDVPSNRVEAVFEEAPGDDGVGHCWRLYGKKFFCSATQADVALVTAKPKGTASADQVAVFAVPSWLDSQKEKGVRNGFTIDRLKQKLGTAELPTAEITYEGAVAYPVGPLSSGLADIVGIVLTLSRLHVALGLAAAGLRAAREATWYAHFRSAFGVEIARFPLLKNQLDDVNEFARRSVAGLFKIYAEFVALGETFAAGFSELRAVDDVQQRRRLFRLRELILWQKLVVADEAPAKLRLAISFFGGHGIMEDFTALPRLMRDAMIMELWEGPRNVLLTQIHRDVGRASAWYPAGELCRDLLAGCDTATVDSLAGEFEHVMSHPHVMLSHPSLLTPDARTSAVCRQWERLSTALFQAYQKQALAELDDQP